MNILIVQPEGEVRDNYFPKPAMDALEKLGNVKLNCSGKKFTEAVLAEHIQGVQICITHWDTPVFTDAVLKNTDKLQMIAHAAGSVAGFITEAVYEKGIKVCSANTVMAKYVAEGVLTYMLASLRNIPAYDQAMKTGEWPTFGGYGTLYDSKIGLVGLGTTGAYLLDLLVPFHVEVNLYDPYITAEQVKKYSNVRLCPLDEVLSQSDIISIHASRTPETFHMLNENKLKLIRDGALLINTARGSLIDETALTIELEKKRFNVVLDVYEVEPLPVQHAFRTMTNALLFPHKAAAPAREQMTYAMIEEIKRFVDGESLKYEIPLEKFKLMTR